MPKKAGVRTSWKYRKKSPAYRKQIFMDVFEDLPTVREITPTGLKMTVLRKGRHEIQYRPHPDPSIKGEGSYWITIVREGGPEVGASKNYFESIEVQGLVRIYNDPDKTLPDKA